MNFANAKAITIPQGVVTKIESGGKILWQAVTYKNWVRYSTEADGETIYNGTGYRQGYRVSSSGAEKELTNGACTGFIPAVGGDEIRLSGWTYTHVTASNAINVFDAGFNNIGQMTSQPAHSGVLNSANGWSTVVEETTGVWKWVVPKNLSIAYIRVSGFDDTGVLVGESMIVTKNEEIAS